MSKPHPLRTRRDFLRVQSTGQRFKRTHMVLLVALGHIDAARVGFTVSRKVGNAVIRNRVRRRMREIVRLHPALLAPGYDYVIIAYKSAADVDYPTLTRELTWLLHKASAWVSSRPSSSA